ncbi:MAG: molybdenum cofactor biosysynthesis protein [Verrucomicrobiales bacterium]|nr:molybdenum cofactor biosysynthesis protein [Verrucomicrobiales bacterium]
MQVVHLFISPGHNYLGHHGQPPGEHPIVEVPSIRCVEGRGLEGDRYFDHREDFKGQITFFAWEVYRELSVRFGRADLTPAVFRRNVIVRGVDLNALVGTAFELQGVRFVGAEQCKPCYWMDRAFGPGAEAALEGKGGLRARILSSGELRNPSYPAASTSSEVGARGEA